ncbi:MAG TPA: type II CAAX endopeptidase family protein [Symbiobacteriaceae bacterium]
MAEELRAPWWKWTLFSVAVSVVEVAFMVAGIFVVLFQGVDIRDYVALSRPPFITDGVVAAGFALLLAGQTMVPVLMIPLFRPARVAGFAGFRRPRPGLMRRLVVGAALAAAVQVLWTYVGPVPAEQWRMLEHIMYAVAGGGRFWPMVWIFATVVLMGPLAEEILFRGVAFGLMRSRWGFWIAAAASAAGFGLAHGFANALPTALLGFYFAYQVEQDGSLYGAMALHGLNNLAAVAIMAWPTLARHLH